MRFIEICLFLAGAGEEIQQISQKTATSLTICQGLQRDRCKSQEFSEDFCENFYKWTPPCVKKLSFIEKSEKSRENSQKSRENSQKSREYSNSPPQKKGYLRGNSCKSAVNLKKTAKISEKSAVFAKKSEENQDILQEMKRVRQCNHEYFKKNKDLQEKLRELSTAYQIIADLFDKLHNIARKVAVEYGFEQKLRGDIEKLQEERRKIDNFLKFKAIFPQRFSELVENPAKNTYNQYIDDNIGILLRFILLKI